MDDMCIHTSDFPQHLKTLREIFERVKYAKLTITPGKIELCLTVMNFLEHTISNGFLETDDNI